MTAALEEFCKVFRSDSAGSHQKMEADNYDKHHIETTIWGVSKHLFDYSEVVTFRAGNGSQRQYFATDSPRLCRESTYFHERLHGSGCPEAQSRHFELKDTDPSVVACMLRWYRGWDCPSCGHDRGHMEDAMLLAVELRIPRFSKHLLGMMETLNVADLSRLDAMAAATTTTTATAAASP
ncbi:hypothetical protein PV04_02481 [Phialophora macrospora]|uniref:BTB domain-containing protein n=1 Tax=Phialophora macrospora TaxID=1851006 RepID=A0A0D2GDI4_9EURO|nr:hypothetical protein PV04_02481 [Phialophora macrospora]